MKSNNFRSRSLLVYDTIAIAKFLWKYKMIAISIVAFLLVISWASAPITFKTPESAQQWPKDEIIQHNFPRALIKPEGITSRQALYEWYREESFARLSVIVGGWLLLIIFSRFVLTPLFKSRSSLRLQDMSAKQD